MHTHTHYYMSSCCMSMLYLALLDPNIISLLQLESSEPRVKNKKKGLVMYLALLDPNITSLLQLESSRLASTRVKNKKKVC